MPFGLYNETELHHQIQ